MDIVTTLCYKSGCKAYLRKKISEKVQGYIHITCNAVNGEVEILQDGKLIYKHILYGFSVRLEKMLYTESDLDDIAQSVVNSFAEKIFSKYFKF